MSENDPKSDNTSGHGPTQEQPKTCSKLVWSNDLLDEGERVIVENSERSAESAASIVFAIREFSEAGEIPAASYAEEVDDMPSADIDDRKHIAAAKVGRTTVLLTRTLKHFRRSRCWKCRFECSTLTRPGGGESATPRTVAALLDALSKFGCRGCSGSPTCATGPSSRC